MSQPNLGYGAPSEATINQVNTWMRSTPWYQQLLRSWGQSPNSVHLNDAQKQQIVRAAQANGVVVDEGKQEIDDSGNFRNQGHALRNTLIVAGIAGATIATMGAAGVFAGGAAAGGGAGGGAAAAGAGAATAAGTGAAVAPAAAGIWGAGGAGATAIGVGANLFGNLFGAHMQSSATSDAAKIQAQAEERIAQENAASQKYAADLAAKANADALDFSKSGAENAFQNNEVSRAGNYDQWSAAQRRVGSVAKLLGFGDREIPTYRPGVDPNFTGNGGGSGAPAPSGPAAGVSAGGGDIGQQISAYFKSRGVPDSETPYWVQKWGEFGQKDPAYFNSRLAAADIFRTAPASAPPSVASFLGPATTAPGLSAPVNPYAVSQYLG